MKSLPYLQDNGILLETDYPYVTKQGTCQRKGRKSAVNMSKFWRLPRLNIPQVKAAMQNGPVLTALNASGDFGKYTGGVYDPEEPCYRQTNHAVVIVGYGVDSLTGKEFVTIKNSWNERWGEKGYMRIAAHTKYDNASVCGWANYVWEIRI